MIKKQKCDDENLDRWLLTYADLITLLLALFIVLYSMSRIDAQKFERVSTALNSVLAGSPTILSGKGGVLPLAEQMRLRNLHQLRELEQSISKYVTANKLEPEIETILNENDLILHISESAFFEEGKADIKPKAKEFLRSLSQMLSDLPNEIRVEGHTDNIPIRTKQFPSNWELSVTRATNVVRFLVEQCGYDPQKIAALGFGEYRPRFPNDTSENRRRNRRTDIVIINR
ncbi:MAG: OmpA family protein [candidate division Zixibacteria bacterium]|nr:OmpA family protein [candidate division Zixibacteria bacterium]